MGRPSGRWGKGIREVRGQVDLNMGVCSHIPHAL